MSARYVEGLFRELYSSTSKANLQNVLSALSSATALAAAAPLDHLYARLGAINGPFFPAGWGNLNVVNYEEDLRHLVQGPPSTIKLSWKLIEQGNRDGTDYLLYEGTFRTPCLQRVFDALPPESRNGRVQLLMPVHLQAFSPLVDLQRAQAQAGALPSGHAPDAAAGEGGLFNSTDGPAAVIHLAATGDQTFGRRLRLGAPLLKENVCSLVLESPFYGSRRPAAQRGSKLLRVSDLLTLGWATIAESINLLHWLREQGFGPLGMCGLSMGGVHASMTAGLYPGDVAVTPLLAPRSAAVAYCDGAMRAVMAWEPLLKEVDENNNHITQVVMSAGRAVTLQLPGGPGGAVKGPGAVQSVALMREATYALADLETAGEKRHMAEAASAAAVVEAAVEAVSSGAAAAGAGGAGVHRARSAGQAGASAAFGDGGPSGVGGGGAAALLRGLPSLASLPSLSIMDVYGALAGAALRVTGRASDGSQQRQGPQQQREQQEVDGLGRRAHADAATGEARRAADDGGPFSGIPDLHLPWRSTVGVTDGSAGGGARTVCKDARGGRWHPPPHGPDMPFPPQHAAPDHDSLAAPLASVAAAAPAAASGAGAGTGGGGGGEGGGGGGEGGGTVLGRRLLGDLGRAVKQLRAGDRRLDNPETVMRLKRVLETYTDITRYPRPRRTDAAVIVAARDDAYVSTESVRQLHAYWPGSELRTVSGGHVSAFLMHQDAFRRAIRDSLVRVARAPPPPPGRQ